MRYLLSIGLMAGLLACNETETLCPQQTMCPACDDDGGPIELALCNPDEQYCYCCASYEGGDECLSRWVYGGVEYVETTQDTAAELLHRIGSSDRLAGLEITYVPEYCAYLIINADPSL